MALVVDNIPDQVLTDIAENMGIEDGDCSDKDLLDISQLSFGEAFDKFLIWNGIQGYSGMILEAVDGLRVASVMAELRELLSKVENPEDTFVEVINCLDQYGHMGDEGLKLCTLATRLGTTPTARSLALLKIKEVIG